MKTYEYWNFTHTKRLTKISASRKRMIIGILHQTKK
jgi:hypothetical protein